MSNTTNASINGADDGGAFLLRAHHGMCLRYFVGEGYSGDFTINMSKVKAYLESHNPLVKIIDAADNVCQKCPNLCNDVCLSGDKVASYDRSVMTHCGLENGTVMHYSDFSNTVQAKILDVNLRENICGDCQWNNLCK